MAGDDELTRLRARAYGPDADIAADPAALARLAELEAAARDAPASAPAAPAAPSPTPVSRESLLPRTDHSPEAARKEGVAHRSSDSRPAPRRRTSPRRRSAPRSGHAAAVLAVAGVGLVLAAVAAAGTIAEASPVPVARFVPADFPGTVVALGDGANGPPVFPIAEDMQWTAPLGAALGWEIWAGRSRSNFSCILLVRGDTERGDCVAPGDFATSGATLYLPPGDIAADLRPAELAGDAAVAFRWLPDQTITVQVER